MATVVKKIGASTKNGAEGPCKEVATMSRISEILSIRRDKNRRAVVAACGQQAELTGHTATAGKRAQTITLLGQEAAIGVRWSEGDAVEHRTSSGCDGFWRGRRDSLLDTALMQEQGSDSFWVVSELAYRRTETRKAAMETFHGERR